MPAVYEGTGSSDVIDDVTDDVTSRQLAILF